MCKITRIKPFVIFYLPSGKSLVSHRSLDHLNQLKLCKPFQIYTVPVILLEAMHAKMITWNHFILCIKPSSPSLLKFSEHFTVRTPMWSFFCCCCLNGRTGAGQPRQPHLVPLPLATHPTWS